MDKDFGIIECGSIIDPEESIFNEPINPKLCLKKKEPTAYLQLF